MNALAKTSAAKAIQTASSKIDLVLVGTITAIDPINITRPDDADDQKGLPTINVATGDGSFGPRPCIPGNTLRGLLRSRSGDLIRHHSGQEMLLPEFYSLYKGGIKGSAAEQNDALKAIQFRESNPVFGLYGMADPMWVNGSLSVSFAYAHDASFADKTTNSSVRGDPFKRNPDLLLELAPSEVERYADQRNFEKTRSALQAEEKKLKPEIRKLHARKKAGEPVLETLQEAEDRLKEIEAKLKKLNEDGNGANTVGRPLPAVPAIAPGSVLNSRIEVRAGRPSEVGLLLDTLQMLSRNCRIGGKVNTGHGLFRARWDLKISQGPLEPFRSAGFVSVGPEEFELKIEDDLLQEALDAWRAMAADPASLVVNVGAVTK